MAEERIRQFIERQAARGAAPCGVARLQGPDDYEVAARTRQVPPPRPGIAHGPERRETSSDAFPRFGLGPDRLQEWKPVLKIKIQATTNSLVDFCTQVETTTVRPRRDPSPASSGRAARRLAAARARSAAPRRPSRRQVPCDPCPCARLWTRRAPGATGRRRRRPGARRPVWTYAVEQASRRRRGRV